MPIINVQKAYTYFKNRFAMKSSSKGWLMFDCPFCINGEGKRKHAVNFSYEMCKCWSCGYKDHITQFVMDYENVVYTSAKDIINSERATNITFEVEEFAIAKKLSEIPLPTGFNSILDGDGILGKRARKYLEGRGFDLQYLDQLGFGYCNEHDDEANEDYYGYIIIPLKKRGKLVYYIGRDYIGNWLRYKNPAKTKIGVGKSQLWFNGDALDLYGTCYLTEGWADAMTMGKAGCSSQGWQWSREQKIEVHKGSCKRLVFLPDVGIADDGKTFYQKAVQLALEFVETKECLVVDFKSADLDGKDVNDFGRKKVMELIANTPILTEGKAMDILMD